MVWISLDMNCQNRIADHANTLLTLLSFWQGPPFLACYVSERKGRASLKAWMEEREVRRRGTGKRKLKIQHCAISFDSCLLRCFGES